MKRHRTPLTIVITLTAMVAGLLPGVVPGVMSVGAAPLPHIFLHVGSGTRAISVVDRTRFLVDATGFQSGEPVKLQATFTTYAGDNIVQNRAATANPSGNVANVTMFAPAGAKAGWANVTATGQTSNKQAQGRVYVTYRPYIVLNSRTVTIGSSVAVNGHAFVSNSQVRVEVTVQDNSGNSPTLTATAAADNNGNFTKWIKIPGYTRPGTYTFTATDLTGGFKRYAKVTATQKPAPKATATATPKPLHPQASVLPAVTLPNQDVTFTGTGFPGNVAVTVSVTVNLRGGGNRSIAKAATTDSNGNFTTAFRVPYKTAPGTYTVTGTGSGSQASGQLQVLALSSHPKNLSFRWVSLWYHTARQGTWNYMAIQSTLQTKLGIWVHVIFPSGQHLDIFTVTDNNGHWGVRFNLPRRAVSSHSNTAYITFQLWHGKQTTQSFVDFTLV